MILTPIEFGSITTDAREDWSSRAAVMDDAIRDILSHSAIREAPSRYVILEMPLEAFSGMTNVSTLPRLGMAAGWVQMAVVTRRRELKADISVTPPRWLRGYARVPKGDRNKETRQQQARELYGLEPGVFGSRTRGKDIADALLLAHWRAKTVERGAIVIAFDPSMSCTGYAIVRREDSDADLQDDQERRGGLFCPQRECE